MEWKSIKENGYPEKEDDYLIYSEKGDIYVAYFYKYSKYTEWVIRCECQRAEDCLLDQDLITHWMPLPKLPYQK
jgi:hypothetical protein